MENKHVGFIMIGIAALEVVIVFLFKNALEKIVDVSCTMSSLSCPMYSTITQQTYMALAFVGILIIIGVALIFTKPHEKIVVKKIREKKSRKKIDLSDLRSEDKNIFKMIQENGAMFQADIIEKAELSKQKVSKIIDRLEGRGLVERKRRGMTNVVVLKEN